MRTNIDIDDATLDAAMRAGPFKTKKDAVEAGLQLLARQAANREILKWEGKLRWDGDADDAVTVLTTGAPAGMDPDADVAPASRVVADVPAVPSPIAIVKTVKPPRGRR